RPFPALGVAESGAGAVLEIHPVGGDGAGADGGPHVSADPRRPRRRHQGVELVTAEAAIAEPLDPRLHAYRPYLAALGLRGRVEAARFAEPVAARIAVGLASVREAPRDDARQATELLHGEAVDVIERDGGWAWVQNRDDGYVGYLREAALTAPVGE